MLCNERHFPSVGLALVVPDAHYPFHDRQCVQLLKGIIEDLKPEAVISIGDLADCWSISRFAKSRRQQVSLDREIEAASWGLDELGITHYALGNHESRFETYIQEKAPQLEGMVSWASSLDLDKRGIHWCEYGSYFAFGDCYFSHDFGVSGLTAGSRSLNLVGSTVVFGHTHAGNMWSQPVLRDDHPAGFVSAVNVGWIGDHDQIFYRNRAAARRSYQHGFGIIEQDPKGGTWGRFVPITRDYRALVDGHVFGVR